MGVGIDDYLGARGVGGWRRLVFSDRNERIEDAVIVRGVDTLILTVSLTLTPNPVISCCGVSLVVATSHADLGISNRLSSPPSILPSIKLAPSPF